VEKAGRTLRRRGLAARRIAVGLDFSDGRRCVRQRAVPSATASDMALFATARTLLYLAWRRRVRVRHLRLICDRLTFPPAQRALFPNETALDRRHARLVATLDDIRTRFGMEAIKVGRTLAA
jgi:DNA polymerase-4